MKVRITAEKTEMDAIGQAQSKISATKAALVAEIQAIKSRLGTAKQVHTDKDDQISTLKLEIKHQNDIEDTSTWIFRPLILCINLQIFLLKEKSIMSVKSRIDLLFITFFE